MPWLVVFWIVPPLGAAPVPVTVSPPLDPVVLSTIPLGAPFADMLRNVSPLPPIVVFATLSAVPVVVASVLVAPVTFAVPPLVALKAAFVPVERLTPPENVTVPLSLLS